jgi:hypothetical protein
LRRDRVGWRERGMRLGVGLRKIKIKGMGERRIRSGERKMRR